MQHAISPTAYGALGADMTNAIERCVHCGFCLSACPTYQVLGLESDSPRGRILLMKEVLEDKLPAAVAQPYIDRCLGCLACEPACPSGVPYRDLISPYRAVISSQLPRSWRERARHWLLSQTLPWPRRFRLMAWLGGFAKPFARFLPRDLRTMLDLLPARLPDATPLQTVYPALGERRARVALLAGCAQQVLAPEINAATIAVLTRQGVEVVVPPAQTCCGALAWHVGNLDEAQWFAQSNLRAFPRNVDAIVTNAAGCGSGLHEYPLILKGTHLEAEAKTFAHKVLDVSVFLAQLGLRGTFRLEQPVRVAYHDACHLANAQGVTVEPRSLLRSVENLTLVELANPHLCCGSAGSYNLDQPTIANQLGQDKAAAILAANVTYLVSGNIGCMNQLNSHLTAAGWKGKVLHLTELLAQATVIL